MAVLASGSFVRADKAGQPSTSYSENITIPAGTNRRLFLFFVGNRFTPDTQSVPTFAGSAMSVVGDTAPGGGATSPSATRVVGYEVVSPAVGTGAFAVTNPGNVNDGVWYYLVIDESTGTASATAISEGPSTPITSATPAAGVDAGEIGFVAGSSVAYSGGGVLSGTTQVGVIIAGHCAGYRIGANPGVGTWPSNQAAALTLVAPMSAGADTTPPTLSSPSGTGGLGVCSGSVSTNESNGTLYAVATDSATAPSAAQVKLGQDHTGAAALRVVSQAVSATGTQTIASGAITGGAGTRYWHFMHEDAATNQSTVSSSAGFSITAPLSVTLDALRDESNALRTAYTVDKIWAIRVSDNVLVATWTAQTTNGSGVLPALSDAALTAVPHVFVTYTATGLKSGSTVRTPA